MLSQRPPRQPHTYKHTTVMLLGKSPMPGSLSKQFISVFTIIVFVQNTMNYIWMKRKFSPLYDRCISA